MPYLKDRYLRNVKQTADAVLALVYKEVGELSAVCYKTSEPVPFSQKETGERVEMSKGETWGQLFDCGWFNFKGKVPEDCAGKKVALLIDINGEGLIFDKEGVPVRGLTCVSSEFEHRLGMPGKRVYLLGGKVKGGEAIDLWVDGGCNDLFGKYQEKGTLKQASIALVNDLARDLYYDMYVLINLLEVLDSRSAQYDAILMGLYEASLQLKTYSQDELTEMRKAAKNLYRSGGEPYLKFTAIGHAHIDLAWLWPIRETRRKAARTFSTVLELMDRYPEYKFGASQPQMYQWVKEDHPKLYEKVKERIKEGRWEVQGCMWVEADTNVSGGEALVRQVLYGKQFYMEEFGIEVKNLWLPDVFGYNAGLPQILKKSGCDYFMTQKLSWSEHNKFPHQTFMWEGIDGSQVFTHMLPEETYNGSMMPKHIKFAEANYIDKGICDEALMLFGIGDGGGGPGPEHLERYSRVKDLQGLCPVENNFAQPMLERLEGKTRGRLKTWKGELYLEKHQGTFTTQAKNKLYNRRMELALRELEFAVMLSDSPYPKAELDEIWKEVLLYQFHDIIPGSSIKRVYDESIARYEVLYDRVETMIKECYEKLAGKNTVFNALSWEREEAVTVDGRDYLVKVPALGYTSSLTAIENPAVKAGNGVLENGYLKASFGADGQLISLFDKTNDREALSGPSNLFAVYEDVNSDCWDIDIIYSDKKPEYFTLESSDFEIQGAKAVCRQVYTYGKSKLTAVITLSHESKKLDIRLNVDWHENQKMLRTNVTANVYTDHASYEIPFGKINRANNDNTLWQLAQFEVCGHKWVDLSQPDYGVALLNDCKYGFKVYGNVIDMNLLRSQNYPGEQADRGSHEIGYAIYPHMGDESQGQVSRAAYDFNVPLRVVKGQNTGEGSLFKVDGELVVEAIKQAEDGNGMIIRVYEPYGRTVKGNISFNENFSNISSCDLMEKNVEKLASGNHINKVWAPFEIATFRLVK